MQANTDFGCGMNFAANAVGAIWHRQHVLWPYACSGLQYATGSLVPPADCLR